MPLLDAEDVDLTVDAAAGLALIVLVAGLTGIVASSKNAKSASGSFFDAFGGSFLAVVVEVFAAVVLVVDEVVVFAVETFDVLDVVAAFAVELTFDPALSRSRLTLLETELT